MSRDPHFQGLIDIYQAAPINEFYRPVMFLEDRKSQIEIDVTDKMYHTFGFMHGSVYFKMLDDAAYFASHTIEKEFFLLTVDFRIDFTRPFRSGRIIAHGIVQHVGKKDILARADVYDTKDRILATGVGRFTRSNMSLNDLKPYRKR